MAEKQSDIDALDSKIRAAKGEEQVPYPEKGITMDATRVATEMVAGVAVGSFIGYHLDQYFGTLPLFFILCFFLGVAGGAFTIYKLATSRESEE